jgi:hypothetical protein
MAASPNSGFKVQGSWTMPICASDQQIRAKSGRIRAISSLTHPGSGQYRAESTRKSTHPRLTRSPSRLICSPSSLTRARMTLTRTRMTLTRTRMALTRARTTPTPTRTRLTPAQSGRILLIRTLWVLERGGSAPRRGRFGAPELRGASRGRGDAPKHRSEHSVSDAEPTAIDEGLYGERSWL